jgi:hypothetical protein
MMAWFRMTRGIDASTVTSKVIVAVSPTFMLPPIVAFAPAPRRTRTVLEPERYSPWSSPGMSVFDPGFEPVTLIEPGT